MATFFLLNSVTINNGPTVRYRAGNTIDDAVDPVAQIQAAGGVLWPSADTFVTAAAALVSAQQKNRGLNDEDSTTLMSAAAEKSLLDRSQNDVGAAGAALTNANATIAVTDGRWRTMPAATITADRTLTMSTTGAKAGDQITITRLGTELFQLIITGQYTFASGKSGFVKMEYNGSAWVVRELAIAA